MVLVFFGFFVYKKYKDKNYLGVSLLSILALVIDLWKFYFKTNSDITFAFSILYSILIIWLVFRKR